ncbi:hypothetical protein ACHAWF_013098 [Thalassiosira exigua]
MLTSWKRVSTSIVASSACNVGGSSRKRKDEKKARRKHAEQPSSDSISEDDAVAIGAQFIPSPLPLGATSGKVKKRRKVERRGDATASLGDGSSGRILCLTSPHRVLLLSDAAGDGDGNGNGNEKYSGRPEGTKDESRDYVARPGRTSRFALHRRSLSASSSSSSNNNNGKTNKGDTFAGMIAPGAHYCPSSNLIYVARDEGREVAVWSAVPSSILSGPDDPTGSVEGTGRVDDARKRKSQPQQGGDAVDHSARRLKLPKGRAVATLTPFFATKTPSSARGKDDGPTVAGAAGVCDDGSVWVAARIFSDGSWSELDVVVVLGTSAADEGRGKGASAAGMGTATAKRKIIPSVGDACTASWMVLDSRTISVAVESDAHDQKPSAIMAIRSVILSEARDGTRTVFLRNHRMRIARILEKDGKVKTTPIVDSYSWHEVLKFEPSEGMDVAVDLDARGESVLIIHRRKNGGWMSTHLDLSYSSQDSLSIESTASFPLRPGVGKGDEVATVFSFGRVGKDVVAVLMKSRVGTKERLLLRIVDLRRRAELHSKSLTEEGGNLSKTLLCGKICCGMVTDETDGAIALLIPSNKDDKAVPLLDILFSRVKLNSQNELVSSSSSSEGTSLASALRCAATSAPAPIPAVEINSIRPKKAGLDVLIQPDVVSSKVGDEEFKMESDDDVSNSCELLIASAMNTRAALMRGVHGDAAAKANKKIVNGEKRDGSKIDKKRHITLGWKESYQEGCALIARTNSSKMPLCNNTSINGMKRGKLTAIVDDIPKEFVETAFRETTNILLLVRGEATRLGGQLELQHSKISEEATFVLVESLRSGIISARKEYGIDSTHGGNILQLLKACLLSPCTKRGTKVGRLHVVDAILEHVQDVPERVLVFILRFFIRNVEVEDATTYYSSSITGRSKAQKKGSRLTKKYTQATKRAHEGDGTRQLAGTLMLTHALLDFASRVVMYSRCNRSFLTAALRDEIDGNGEAEALLLTLAKLLERGGAWGSELDDNDNEKKDSSVQNNDSCMQNDLGQINLTQGVIHWISALTDAHSIAISDATMDGGLAVNRVRRAIRRAAAQSEVATDLREISDIILESTKNAAKPSVVPSSSRDVELAPYSVERLTF